MREMTEDEYAEEQAREEFFARQRREEARERAVERASRRPANLPGHFTSAVVGVTFSPTYPDNIYALDHAMKSRLLFGLDGTDPEPLPAILVRDPDNPHDPNAIAIHCPMLGNNAHIGHLPRALAARLAPIIDQGHLYAGAIHYVKVHDDHPDKPGVEIQLVRVPDDEWRLPDA